MPRRSSTTPPSFTPRGDSVQVNFRLHGKRHRKSFPTQEEGQRYYEQMLTTPPEQLPSRPSPGPHSPEGEPTLEWLLRYARDKHWKGMPSEQMRAKDGTHCINLLGPTRRVSTVDEAAVKSLVYTLWHSGLPGTVINRKLVPLSVMLRLAYERGWIKRIPEVGKRAEWVQPLRIMSEAEEEKLLTWAASMGMVDFCDLVALLVDTGISLPEALGLIWEDVGEKLRVKGVGERMVPLTQRARDILNRRIGAPAVFAGLTEDEVQRQWSLGRAVLGLESDLGFTVECLRDTFCMRTIRRQPGLPGLSLISEATGMRQEAWKYLQLLRQEESSKAYPPLARRIRRVRNLPGPLPPKPGTAPTVAPTELLGESPGISGGTAEDVQVEEPESPAVCDPDELRMVVEAWPWLPEAVRVGIVAMVSAVQENGIRGE